MAPLSWLHLGGHESYWGVFNNGNAANSDDDDRNEMFVLPRERTSDEENGEREMPEPDLELPLAV